VGAIFALKSHCAELRQEGRQSVPKPCWGHPDCSHSPKKYLAMRWTFAFDRTHNRIRSPRFETSGQWANVDKGSRQNRLVTSGQKLALKVVETKRILSFLLNKRPVQNCFEQVESDCLIKTKQCASAVDGLLTLWFLLSASIVKAMKFDQAQVNSGSNYDSLKVATWLVVQFATWMNGLTRFQLSLSTTQRNGS